VLVKGASGEWATLVRTMARAYGMTVFRHRPAQTKGWIGDEAEGAHQAFNHRKPGTSKNTHERQQRKKGMDGYSIMRDVILGRRHQNVGSEGSAVVVIGRRGMQTYHHRRDLMQPPRIGAAFTVGQRSLAKPRKATRDIRRPGKMARFPGGGKHFLWGGGCAHQEILEPGAAAKSSWFP